MEGLKNENIVCLAFPSWRGDYLKSTKYMMSGLANGNKVLYVDYAYTIKDVITARKKKQLSIKKILGLTSRIEAVSTETGGEVNVLSLPPVLPINWIKNKSIYRKLLQLNAAIVKPFIVRAMRRLKMKDPIVISALQPFLGLPLAGKLGEKKHIYYCYDNIAAARWASKHGGRIETEYLRKVDAAIFTSSNLYTTKGGEISGPTDVINNGVDFSLFHEAKTYHDRYKEVRKVVGYLGSIDDRLDFEMLYFIARHLPSIDFHFVGRVTTRKISLLETLPNVSFLGSKGEAEIPEHLGKFNVGLIPFITNEFTKNIYPLKVNEYLAAGIPVISTAFTDLAGLKDILYIVHDAPSCKEAIVHALTETDTSLVEQRIQVARSNSWEHRVSELEMFIGIVLKQERYKYA